MQYHTVVAGQWPCKTLVIVQCKIHNIKCTFDLHFALMVKSVRWWCVNLSIGIGQTFFHMSLSPCLAVAVAGAPALFAPFVTLSNTCVAPFVTLSILGPLNTLACLPQVYQCLRQQPGTSHLSGCWSSCCAGGDTPLTKGLHNMALELLLGQ